MSAIEEVKKNDFRTTVDNIKIELGKIKSKNKDSYQDWMKVFFNYYADRFEMDNERIWKIGAIFIPLALSPLALLTKIESLRGWDLYILAFISIILIWVWLFIAENQRAFWQKSEAWIVAIKEMVGIENIESRKLQRGSLNKKFTFRGAIQRMRLFITLSITGIWIILICLYHMGVLIKLAK